jgi:enamine deaminase RidA (YjgF/YER057c/UK114 family)
MAITRIDTNARSSQAVINGGTVYLSGQVAVGETITDQMTKIIGQIDALLAKAGTDKTNLLSAMIWLADINDFSEMNTVWDKWVAEIQPPARATGESRLAAPEYRVEIVVVAAIP